MRAINLRLWVLLVQALSNTLLARDRALELNIQRDVHSLTQTLQHGLLTGQPQLRVLLLQAMMKLGKPARPVGQEIVHRHFQTLLTILQLTQQLQLIAAHHFRGCGGRWRA